MGKIDVTRETRQGLAAQEEPASYKRAASVPVDFISSAGPSSKKMHEASGVINPFNNDMAITHEEVAVVREIIAILNCTSTFGLIFSNLKELGEKVKHVHPFCFFWAIHSHPESMDHLSSVKQCWIKWPGFLGKLSWHGEGFEKSMHKQYSDKKYEDFQYEFEAFYVTLGLKKHVVDPHVQAKNWGDFAAAIIDKNSYI